MGRPKGSKNRSTILREARETTVARGLLGHEQDFLDSLQVVDENLLQAVSIAEKIAPYRHPRLSAMKLAGDPNNPAQFKDDATADELREEIMRRLGELQEAGVLDLEALPAPKDGIANQSIPGVDQSSLNGK